MKVIISPAKKMKNGTDYYVHNNLPIFLPKTKTLMEWIQSLSYLDQKNLWACNDVIANENTERFSRMDLTENLSPALLAYDGIQYTYMAPSVFEKAQFDYIQNHVRILSGFYGVLKPMDGVVPYRLEIQAKVSVAGVNNLYDYWGDDLYREVMDQSRIIVNLASKEYSRCVEKFLVPGDRFITCIFGELDGNKIVQKGVYVKMARGDMVRFMAENRVETPEALRSYDRCCYHFDESRSTDTEYVFIRSQVSGKTGFFRNSLIYYPS